LEPGRVHLDLARCRLESELSGSWRVSGNHCCAIRSVDAIHLLLAVCADPALETRIDDYTTALEEDDNADFEDGASLLRDAMAGRRSDGQ